MYRTNYAKLKEAISNNGYSLAKVAEFLGIDRTTLYRRIKNNSLTIGDMQKISELLCMSGDEAKAIFLADVVA